MWPRIVSASIGVWLLAAPDLLDYAGAPATNDRIVGPLVATVALVASWDVTRSLRWSNVVLGVWLILAPWLLGAGTAPTVNSMLSGALLAGCALQPGPSGSRMGGGWRAVLHPDIGDAGTAERGRSVPSGGP
jgi:hypothetical protein